MTRWYEANFIIRGGLLPLLIVLVIGSAMGVIYLQHREIQLYIHLQGLKKQYDRALEEQGRLRLEEAAWGNLAKIEERARGELGMSYPEGGQRVVIHQ